MEGAKGGEGGGNARGSIGWDPTPTHSLSKRNVPSKPGKDGMAQRHVARTTRPRPARGGRRGRRSRGRTDVPRTRLSNRHLRWKTPKNAFRRPSRTLPRSPTLRCRRLALAIVARASRQASDHHRLSFPFSFVLFGQRRRSQARPIVRLEPGTTRSKGDRSAEGEMRAVVEDEATVRPRGVACRRKGRID